MVVGIGLMQPTTLEAQSTGIQVENVKEDGLKVTRVETPYGNLIVNLPDDMSDSDTISGTVIAEPKGETEEEKNSNSDMLSGYVVDIAPKKAPEKKVKCKSNTNFEPFCLSIPDFCGAVDVIVTPKLVVGAPVPKPVATCSVACLPKPPVSHLPPAKAILPTKGTCGKPIVIKEKCDGKFNNSKVTVGKETCPMLAESPRQQVAQSPKDLVGKFTIECVEGDRKTTGVFENFPIQYMTMRSPAAPAVRKGIDLTGNWMMTAKNDYGSQDIPTTITQTGNVATWKAAGEHWSVSYHGTLSGNKLDTTETDDAGKFTARGVLTYDENADTLSGVLVFVFANGPQGVTVDLLMHRTSR